MALVETLNALGVSLSSNPSSSQNQQKLGGQLTQAALAIQLSVIVVFILLATVFYRRCIKGGIKSKNISVPLTTLYVSMLLILVRCIYRLAEHVGNTTVDLDNLESLKTLSPIMRYEWFFYVFEASLMLVNSGLWNIWHPGRYLPRNNHVYLMQDGNTEVEAEEVVDGRPLLAKAGSILTFGIFFHRKSEPGQQRYLLNTWSS